MHTGVRHASEKKLHYGIGTLLVATFAAAVLFQYVHHQQRQAEFEARLARNEQIVVAAQQHADQCQKVAERYRVRYDKTWQTVDDFRKKFVAESLQAQIHRARALEALQLARNGVALPEGKFREPQRNASLPDWRFDPLSAHVLNSLSRAPADYPVEITKAARRSDWLRVRVRNAEGNVVVAWEAHPFAVFAIRGNRLYRTDFDPELTGGSVLAVDLRTGQQIWRTRLQALGKVSKVDYRNRMNLIVEEQSVVIYGHESAGDYVEYLDPATGESRLCLRDVTL